MVRIYALGGLGEVGMNCLALEEEGEVMLVDCGVTFDGRGLGVDIIHPDFSALKDKQVVGLFLTHGHEDHIGAVPYLLKQHDVPIWGTKYTLGLLRERADEHEILAHARLIEVKPRERYGVGRFTVEPIRVTHSIADATALAITTREGTVIHTGDFKFDEEPTDGEAFDVERLKELGHEGVALLMSDSTSIDTVGPAGSEAGVAGVLDRLVSGAKGAVIVGLFASNVHRLRALGEIAARTGRKIVQLGRSIQTHARVARATGYLHWRSDLVMSADRIGELPREKVLAVASGAQGEVNAALARLARGEHPALTLEPTDTVILSSRVIPGNEPEVFAVMNDLLRRGVALHTWFSDRGVHVSGHAARVEQERMIALTRPRTFLPLHGTLHHLVRHAAMARDLGIDDVAVLENGDVGILEGGRLRKDGREPAGRVHVFAGRAIPGTVLKERMGLAAEGIVFAVVRRDDVHLTARGVLGEREASVLEGARAAGRAAIPAGAEEVRLAIRRALARAVGYKPTVLVTVLE
jgi:ribonuclease J